MIAGVELKPRRLVHAMTLNTSLPLKSIALPAETVALCQARRPSAPVSRLADALRLVLDDVDRVVGGSQGPLAGAGLDMNRLPTRTHR